MFSLVNYWRSTSAKEKSKSSPMFDFFTSYAGSWFWPVAIVSLLVLTQASRKLRIVGIGGYYLLFSQDKSFKLPNYDPGTIDVGAGIKVVEKETKTLILIRHGESTWNEVFNRGINWKLPIRVLYALARETILFVTSDSVLYDSPLGSMGITQSRDIDAFIKRGYLGNGLGAGLGAGLGDGGDVVAAAAQNGNENEPLMKRSQSAEEKVKQCLDILKGSNRQGSIIISSPLRRCIETVSLGCFERLNSDDKEQIHLVSTLQEMTRNVDGVSLSPAEEIPPLSWSMRSLESEYEIDFEEWMQSKVNIENKGSFKSVHNRGDSRMKAFIRWLFESKLTTPCHTVIVSGHSLWFRCFFRAYYPRNVEIEGKREKIFNGGIVAVNFSRYRLSNGTTRFRIEPDSVVTVLKGFERSKKKI